MEESEVAEKRPAAVKFDKATEGIPRYLRKDDSFIIQRHRARSLDEAHLQHTLGAHLIRHKGSIRTNFSQPTNSRFVRWLRSILNWHGKNKNHSLFLFEKKNRFRVLMKKVARSLIFQLVLALVVILNIVMLGFYQPELYGDDKKTNAYLSLSAIVFIVIYLVEAAINVVAFGFILQPKAYLRHYPFMVDVLVIVFGLLYVVAYPTSHITAEVFASLMSLKLLKVVAISNSARFILRVLGKSIIPLTYIYMITFCVMVFFALVGMELFLGTLHGGCWSNYTAPSGRLKSILVSDFPCSIEKPTYTSGSHDCPTGSLCSHWPEGPNFGITSFDNFGLAMLTVFQVITLEGWSGVLYLYESALGFSFTWLYFFLVVFFGSIFILNLILGVLTSVFVGVNDKEEDESTRRQLKETKRVEEDLRNYHAWIERADELDLPSETGSIGKRPSLFLGSMWNQPAVGGGMDSSEDEEEDTPPHLTESMGRLTLCVARCRRPVERVVKHKAFFVFVIASRTCNLVLLMALHFPSTTEIDTAIYALNYMFSVVYIIELGVKLLGRGPVRYFRSHHVFPFVETAFTVLNLFDLLLLQPFPVTRQLQLSVIVNACRAVQLVRVFKYTKYWKAMKEIISTVFQLVGALASLLGLISIFLVIFTILGHRLFAKRLSRTEFIQPNFDDIGNSLLLVFQLLTTEDWHNVLYSSVNPWVNQGSPVLGVAAQANPAGYLTVLYFVVAIIVGGFILVSTFLAIAVEKLLEVRALEEASAQQSQEEAKQRRLREEHLNALKHTSDKPLVQRRTIRRVLKYLSANPQQRAKEQQESPTRNWWKQMSTRSERMFSTRDNSSANPIYRQSRSVPSTPSSALSHPGNAPSLETIPSVEQPLPPVVPPSTLPIAGVMTSDVSRSNRRSRRKNPLRLMRQKSEFYDQQKRRLGGSRDSDDDAFTPLQGNEEEEEKSVSTTPESGPLPRPSKYMAQLSSASTPASATSKTSREMDFERTQSWSDPKSASSLRSRASEELPAPPRLDVIAEGQSASLLSLEEGGAGRGDSSADRVATRSSSEVSGLQTSAQSAQQTTAAAEGSLATPPQPRHSLETASQHSPGQQSPLELSASSRQESTKMKLKDKMIPLWKWVREYFGNLQFDPVKELEEIPLHSSFFIFSPYNRFRRLCYKTVCLKSFQTITFTAVFISSLLLTIEVPIGADVNSAILCTLQDVIIILDSLFVVYFLIEMLLKMLALGVFFHKGSYFRGVFNIIDFIVTMTSLIPIIYYLANDNTAFTSNNPFSSDRERCIAYSYNTEVLPTAVGALRVVRVLRPFRAIRIGGLYLVVNGLYSSLKSIGSIFFVDCLAIFIFGVIGVNIFRGNFSYCTDPIMRTELDCQGKFYVYHYTLSEPPDLTCPRVEDREWLGHGLNFDHIGRAILSLFAMFTVEGWQNVMYSGINSVPFQDPQTSLGPEVDHRQEASVYFILYMVIMAFVLVNLFVGFVIITFQEVGVKSFRESQLNRNQRNCLYFALTARQVHRFIPRFKIHQRLHDLSSHIVMKIITVCALIANCILLACASYDPASEGGISNKDRTIYWINIGFTTFFAIEAFTRVWIKTPAVYFQKAANSFEFCVAICAVIELVVQRTVSSIPIAYQYTHIVSTFRILRLMRYIPKVRLILWTVVKSLEIFPWVGVLLICVFMLYALVGMQVFGTIRPVTVDVSDELSQITQYNNFANFAQALLLMIRVATGENWQDVMLSCVGGQLCANDDTMTCGDNFTFIFFPSFYFLSSILILNLFVAIIIDNFDYIVQDSSKLAAHQLSLFVKLWSIYDPKAEGKLSPDDVISLLRECNPPVGWGRLCPSALAAKKMMKLNLPLKEEGKVTFTATLFGVVRTSLKIHCEGCANCATACNPELRRKLKVLFPTIADSVLDEALPTGSVPTVAHEYAARLVQDCWRSFVLRRRKTLQAFQGERRTLIAGARRLPDAGPDLSRRTANFARDLPTPPLGSRRESSGSMETFGGYGERTDSPFSLSEISTTEALGWMLAMESDNTPSLELLPPPPPSSSSQPRRGSLLQSLQFPATISEGAEPMTSSPEAVSTRTPKNSSQDGISGGAGGGGGGRRKQSSKRNVLSPLFRSPSVESYEEEPTAGLRMVVRSKKGSVVHHSPRPKGSQGGGVASRPHLRTVAASGEGTSGTGQNRKKRWSNTSELSFASAYSSPYQSDSGSGGEEEDKGSGYDHMETTV